MTEFLGPFSEVYERQVTASERQQVLEAWLSGMGPLSEEETRRIPEFGGPIANSYRSQWLALDRGARLSQFLEGEGLLDGEPRPNLGGQNTEFYEKGMKALQRRAALQKWLSGS